MLPVGKTFKGLTDEEFEWITQELLKDKISESGGVVWVNPRIVVEVAFDEIQKSDLYPSGYALRLARIVKIRTDKSVIEADTMAEVKKLARRELK